MASSAERDALLFAAKAAEQAQRHDEMVSAIKKLVMMKVELTPDERSTLSMSYNKVIDPRRSSWDFLQQLKVNEEINGASQKVIRISEVQEKIETELSSVCEEMINLLDNHLIPFTTDDENLLFYMKMKGDYYRYMAEYKTDNEKKKVINNSLKAYQAASAKAESFPPLNPIMLGSILNYSVFLYDVVKARKRAMAVARRTLDKAEVEITSRKLNEEMYEEEEEEEDDSLKILELMKKNLACWAADLPLGWDIDPYFTPRRLSL